MSDFPTLKAKLVTILEGLDDFDSASVFNYQPELKDITKDPHAVVIASDLESDYGNTAENRREFSFVISVYVERKDRGESDAEALLGDIITDITNAIDQDYTLTGSAIMVKAMPGAWLYAKADKEYRVAQLRVTALTWYDTTT